MGSFRSGTLDLPKAMRSSGLVRVGSDNTPYRNQSIPQVTSSVTSPTRHVVIVGTPDADASALVDAILRRGDSPHTRRAYRCDLRVFGSWLAREGISWTEVTRDDLDRYREWLASRFARSTVNRRLSVVRTLYTEAQQRGLLVDNRASLLRSLRGRDDRDGGALTRPEARSLIDAIADDLQRPSRHLLALRDLAIVTLLLRTGLRRSELAGILISDLGHSGGHRILTIDGKGNVVRTIKLPTDVARTIDEWTAARTESDAIAAVDEPLFVQIDKVGRQRRGHALSDRSIYAIVERRLRQAGLASLGPHALRATFVTLALEGGAPLHIVQRAAGHADPRTTERYWRRKDGLDDNAVDYVRV